MKKLNLLLLLAVLFLKTAATPNNIAVFAKATAFICNFKNYLYLCRRQPLNIRQKTEDIKVERIEAITLLNGDAGYEDFVRKLNTKHRTLRHRAQTAAGTEGER